MAVWTISAQEGSEGEEVAASLAAVAGVPLLDRETLGLLPHEPDSFVHEFGELEEVVGGRLELLALSMAIIAGSADAVREFEFIERLPEFARAVMAEAARQPCVILAPGAFAASARHPSAVHVRLHAPLAWRIKAYQRDHVVDRRSAEKTVRHDDALKRTWVKSLYHLDIDDSRLFSLVIDASRFSVERLVEILLAAGGLSAAPQVLG
jgi:hypothetical protein